MYTNPVKNKTLVKSQANSRFASDFAPMRSASSGQSTWSSPILQPLGSKEGVQRTKPITINQTPCTTNDMLLAIARMGCALDSKIPARRVRMPTVMGSCNNQWYCPSSPMWSAEWKWKRRSSWPRANAAVMCKQPLGKSFFSWSASTARANAA